MLNSHEFQKLAKQFRAGKISLKEFTDSVVDGAPARKPNEQSPVKSDRGNEPSKTIARLPQRLATSHKGDFGRVLAVGGSVGMSGAIALTGLAAMRSGAGLVKVAVPDVVLPLVVGINPCVMTIPCAGDNGVFNASAESTLLEHAKWSDVLAIGPGMGATEGPARLVKQLYEQIEQPMIVDADGLNSMAAANVARVEHAGQRILTPHPGEFQRLAGKTFTNRTSMESAAFEMAKADQIVIVLKGHQTYITDGEHEYRNDTGNPGMATAGSGDVLTGVIAALVGQGMTMFDAASVAVRIHGVAGDFAAESLGQTSLMATDILDCLPAAFKQHANASTMPIGFQSN